MSLVVAPESVAQQTCPGLLFASDFAGNPVAGAKDSLIAAVQRGEPVRLGWELDFDADGVADLAHWADAAYLSVWQGEVFAQVDAIHRQRPRRDNGTIELSDEAMEWYGSLGTTGVLEGAFSDGTRMSADLGVSITWCLARADSAAWVLLYRNDRNGNRLAGSMEALLAAIRAGTPVRIGWGLERERDGRTASVEHVVSPVFLGIIDRTHVAAQLPEHIAPRHYWDIDQSFFDDPAVMWRGLMTTRGTFDAVWVNRASGEVIRRSPQRAALSWYAASAAPLSTPTLAVPDGVTRDENRDDERVPR